MRELEVKIGAYSPQSFNYIEPEAMMIAHYREQGIYNKIFFLYTNENWSNFKRLWIKHLLSEKDY